jgi:hypothetical protein
MGLFDLTYSNLGEQLLPPRKRLTAMIAWVGGVLLSPLQWLHDLFNLWAFNKDNTKDYELATVYSVGEMVKWLDGSVYICIAATTAGILPNDTNYWLKYSDYDLGLYWRANYTGQKLQLEYALNRNYSTTFEQPPNPSEIYVTTTAIDTNGFTVGIDSTETSTAAVNGDAEFFVGESYTYDVYSLIIYVPTATLAALEGESSPYTKAKKRILTYANQLIFAGVTAKVEAY